MKKRFSLQHFLIGLLLFTLFVPNVAGATVPTSSLTIHKFEIEPNQEPVAAGDGSANQPTIGDPVAGVTYTITQTHSYDLENDKWSEFNGEAQTYTTGSDGKIYLSNIALGRYTIQETAWPAHIVPDETVYAVDIPMTNEAGTEVNYHVHVYPKNVIIRGEVELTKYRDDGKTPLADVKFDLFKVAEDEEEDDEKVNTEPLVTDEDGMIRVDNLAYGDYYFIETATVDGYLLNGEKVGFEIKEQGKKAEVSLNNYKEPEVEKEVDKSAVNREEIVTYTITLQLPNDIKSYKHFNVTDVLNGNLEYVDESATAPTGFTFDFDEDSQTLTWTGKPEELTPGEATITFQAKVKASAPANQSIINEVKIDYNNRYVASSGKDEVPVLVHAGSLSVKKIDGDGGEGLVGAIFELRDSENNLVATGTSGEDGIVVFDNPVDELPYGDYTLTETKAPAEYRLLLNPIAITIDDTKSNQYIEVENFKSDWNLPQTGGMGTMLFTFVGLFLMSGALFLYIRRRKGEIA